jgi:hypothetical protein
MSGRQLPYVALFLIASCLQTGCKKLAHSESESMTFQSIQINESRRLKNMETLPMVQICMDLKYPSAYSNDSILKKVQHSILKDFIPSISDTVSDPTWALKNSIKNRIKMYEVSENASNKNKEDDEVDGLKSVDKNTWWDKTVLQIRHNADGLLSYTVRTDQFTGGNRSGSSLQNTIIDLKTGEKIHEEDLFSSEAIKLINQMIIKKLADKNNVESMDELEQIGYFDLSEISQYKNIYLTNKGITYTYNAYEIGSYDLGTIEVLLSYEDLDDFIEPGSPLTRIHR